jgi:hypothetical protein
METKNTHSVFSNLFLKNRAVYEIMWKHCSAGQATVDNMADTHCMLNT